MPPRHLRLPALLLLALLVVTAPVVAAERYDPRLRFRSLRTAHFTIHFHQDEDALARRLARIAEDVHARLSADLQVDPDRHTHVILVDQHDDANGWATPLPFNTIEISAAAPAPSSVIGYTSDWLRLVFTHEYTHILQLDRSRGLFGGLRKVFGRAPALFPNMFLPGWSVEGLATFHETAATGEGRLRSGEFRSIVDAAARARTFEPIDRTTGALVDWPGGSTSYAYGMRFHEFLVDRFGVEALAELSRQTSGRLPYMPGGAYKRVFGMDARGLWREFERSVEMKAGAFAADVRATRLTARGFVASGPRWLPGGALVYSERTPHDFPALMMVPPDGAGPRRVASRFLGEQLSVSGSRVFFDQRELVRSVGLQSDLYVLERTGGRVTRLTHGARAADPDASPDGRSLACVVQGAGRAALVVYALDTAGDAVRLGAPKVLIDEPETQIGAPRWSPDGTRIAAERRRVGSRPEVVVIDGAKGSVATRIAADAGRVVQPEWLPDGSGLLVSWERPDRPFTLWRVDLIGGSAMSVIAPANGARSAAAAPDGARVAYIGYTVDGYDVFTSELADGGEVTSGLRVIGGDSSPVGVEGGTALPARPYSPASTLLPRFWMPLAETDEDRLEVGAGTVALDVLGRHAYGSSVRWSDRARPDWDFAYAYDRWRPTFIVAGADDLTVWNDADYRETSVEAGVTLPLRTVRRRQVLYGAFRATRERDPESVFDRRSVRLGYQVGTARVYGYSPSPEEGIVLGAAADVARRALGADADAVTVSADARAYPRVGGAHRVLALRAAAAGSWGDVAGRRVLGAGGSAAPGSTIAFGRDAIGLARGFATDDIVGYRAAVVNADYRFRLFTVERGLGRLPVFFRQAHAALFADAAHAWTRRFRVADARASAGVELSADFVLGHYLPITVASGVAVRRDPSGEQDGAAAFARIGYAF
ncbi:MAG TPA: hypothetical protein VK886_04080 [Vicinamibacterales bacterium]|nr:hypothetical protein [Vicinamibacterales bacterium]